MANLLYVTCNLRRQETSRTLQLGYEFLEEYLRWNPEDDVQVLDVYRDSIQRFDQTVLNVWGRIERGEDYCLLSDDERRKISRVWRHTDQFRRCDKYVFVTHSINLMFPAEFKMYIDAICVPDRTYDVTANGAKGRLFDRNRKALHLHALAPYNFGREPDLSVDYLSSVLMFLGIADQETMLVEGDDPGQGNTEEHETVRRNLLEVARNF